jgi:hypothetical protein
MVTLKRTGKGYRVNLAGTRYDFTNYWKAFWFATMRFHGDVVIDL